MQNQIFSENLFQGQRVLVTGGGTGLGLAMAEKLVSLGAQVHLCGRRQHVLEQAAANLQTRFADSRVFVHSVDIRDSDKVDQMVQHIWDEHGGVDALINNAAGNFICPTEDISVNGFKAITETVLNGTFYVTQAVGKRWIATQHPGSVVSIVVTWVWTGSPFVVPSAMSKSAVDTMTKSLAIEWGRHGIRFNAIAPGVIPTEGASARLRPTESNTDALVSQNPMQRLGQFSYARKTAGSTARLSPWMVVTGWRTVHTSSSISNGIKTTGRLPVNAYRRERPQIRKAKDKEQQWNR